MYIYYSQYPSLSSRDVFDVIRLLAYYPDMFGYTSHTTYSSSTYFFFSPQYRFAADEYENAKRTYIEELFAIVDAVNAEAFETDLEKVLFVTNHIAYNYRYDPHTDPEKIDSTDAYGFFSKKYGVCQAYTMAFQAIMEKLGIPCTYCRSASMNHIWNVVQIDGEWYHLDMTWNDLPESDADKVRYDYFLLSTQRLRTIENGLHYEGDDWLCGRSVTCVSTIYDGGLVPDAVSPIIYVEGKWYYVNSSGLMRLSRSLTGAVNVASAEAVYGEKHAGYNTRINKSGIFLLNGSIYFNSLNAVFAWNVSTGAVSIAVDANDDTFELNGSISRCFLEDGRPVYIMTGGQKGAIRNTDPYTYVAEAGCGYYIDGKTLYIRITDPGSMIVAAWYNAAGRLSGCVTFSEPGDYAAETEGEVKVFSLNRGSAAPRRAAINGRNALKDR